MGIKITLKTNPTAYEGRYRLNFMRERVDIAKLLSALKKGQTLKSIFKTPVAESVKKKLREQNFIDQSEKVTATGDAFIDYPLFNESEFGIYSLVVNHIEEDGLDIDFVTRMERKLSENERELSSVSIPDFHRGNEFTFANERNEVGVMNNVELISDGKAYVNPMQSQEIVFDVSKGTYTTDAEFRTGSNINEVLKYYAIRQIEKNAKHFYVDENLHVVVNNLDDFTIDEILNGVLFSYKAGPIEMTNVPLLITELENGYKFIYLWLYDLIMKGGYYSLSEMSEIAQNELVGKPIINQRLRDMLSSVSISKEGFKRYLSNERYNELEYRLRIMDEYLGVQSIVEDESFSNVHDYEQLTSYIADKVSPSDVNRMYLVMGYAFVKRKDNKIRDCLDSLLTRFSNIMVVNKLGKTAVEEEPGLRSLVAEKGVGIMDKHGLNEYFHDRFIILEKNDGTYVTFLCSAEIGQIFHNGEAKGTIAKILNSETVKSGRSLIEMIKE